jgi:FkbM family methyltransferase
VRYLKKYLAALARAHITLGTAVLRETLLPILSPPAACATLNTMNRIRFHGLRYRYDQDAGLYFVVEGQTRHYFANLGRGHWLYSRGIERRAQWLAKSYRLDLVSFEPDDIVLDCGANYADLYRFLQDRIRPENYLSFEPGEDEHRCIQANAPRSRNYRIALSDRDGTQAFYAIPAQGDGSLIDTGKATHVTDVPTRTVDSLLADEGVARVKLLKLEAEGHEPEILEGALGSLARIEYVAVDGGFERGKGKEETLSRLSNRLIGAGFEMVGYFQPWSRALFRNRQLGSPAP